MLIPRVGLTIVVNTDFEHTVLTRSGESIPSEAGPNLHTYAGAMIRRGEAVAEVTATGTRTKFGHTAELVRLRIGRGCGQSASIRATRDRMITNQLDQTQQTS